MDEQALNVAVGNALAAMRRARGVSQSDVAHVLGRTQASISYWENGKRTPNAVDVSLYAAAIGSSPVEVMEAVHKETQSLLAEDEFTRRARELAERANPFTISRKETQ